MLILAIPALVFGQARVRILVRLLLVGLDDAAVGLEDGSTADAVRGVVASVEGGDPGWLLIRVVVDEPVVQAVGVSRHDAHELGRSRAVSEMESVVQALEERAFLKPVLIPVHDPCGMPPNPLGGFGLDAVPAREERRYIFPDRFAE